MQLVHPLNATCVLQNFIHCPPLCVIESNETYQMVAAMTGMHNMYNTLMAYGTSLLLGIPKEKLLNSIHHFKGVDGRFEITKLAKGSIVIVDYAHTPDAISCSPGNCKITRGPTNNPYFRFSCGTRDASKRKHMLSISAEMSDRYILTLDDLNNVSPGDMLEVLNQLNETYGNSKGSIVPDRTLPFSKQSMKARKATGL